MQSCPPFAMSLDIPVRVTIPPARLAELWNSGIPTAAAAKTTPARDGSARSQGVEPTTPAGATQTDGKADLEASVLA